MEFRIQWRPIVLVVAGSLFTLVSCQNPSSGSDHAATQENVLTKVVLGHGYDVTGRYAYSPEIKEAVLDHAKLTAADRVVADTNIATGTFTKVAGSSITDYQSSLATSASVSVSASYLGASFSGEVGAHFSKDKYQSDEYAFATSTSKVAKTAYYLTERSDATAQLPYVSDTFKADAKALTGAALIAKYGTHVMMGGLWGARLDYHMTAKKKTGATASSMGAYVEARAEASYGLASGSLATKGAVDNAYASSFETTSLEISTNAYGGAVEYAQSVQNSQDYSSWIASIASNQIWCDYYPDSLIPIYELVADTTDKAKVETAYNTYLAGKVITVTSTDVSYTVDKIFEKYNFTALTKGGDADINSQSGRTTNYEGTIDVAKNTAGTGLTLTVHLEVSEAASNYTVLAGTTDIAVPVNLNLTSLDASLTRYEFSGSAKGAVGWVDIFVNDTSKCPFLKSLKIKVDGSGDDVPNVGVWGETYTPVHYRP